jgi:hypothetical protein
MAVQGESAARGCSGRPGHAAHGDRVLFRAVAQARGACEGWGGGGGARDAIMHSTHRAACERNPCTDKNKI